MEVSFEVSLHLFLVGLDEDLPFPAVVQQEGFLGVVRRGLFGRDESPVRLLQSLVALARANRLNRRRGRVGTELR